MNKMFLAILAIAAFLSLQLKAADTNQVDAQDSSVTAFGPHPGPYPHPHPGPHPGPYPPPHPGPHPGPYPPPPPPHPYPSSEYIRCESISQHYTSCYFNPYAVRVVSLAQVHSQSPCQEGYSFGVQYNSVWVDHGCRATFFIQRY